MLGRVCSQAEQGWGRGQEQEFVLKRWEGQGLQRMEYHERSFRRNWK